MRKLMLMLGAVTMVVTAGCATLGRRAFSEPVVTFEDVRLRSLGVSGGNIEVVLNVYNPNGFRLDATQLTYNVYADSVLLGQGLIDERFTVQSRDSTRVSLPISFNFAGLGAAGRQIWERGSVDYRVRGDVRVGTPAGQFTVPYDRRGQFSPLSGATSR